MQPPPGIVPGRGLRYRLKDIFAIIPLCLSLLTLRPGSVGRQPSATRRSSCFTLIARSVPFVVVAPWLRLNAGFTFWLEVIKVKGGNSPGKTGRLLHGKWFSVLKNNKYLFCASRYILNNEKKK